jgi:hypothetical protein
MGLLDKLWDDVVAGPKPEKGLGKLRQKHGNPPQGFELVLSLVETEARRVTQSISIKKPPALQTNFDYSDSPVSSPAASSPMASPATRERETIWRSVFHSSQNRGIKATKVDNASPHSPTVYDWVVISALDK